MTTLREDFVFNPVGHTVATVDASGGAEQGTVRSANLYEAFGNIVKLVSADASGFRGEYHNGPDFPASALFTTGSKWVDVRYADPPQRSTSGDSANNRLANTKERDFSIGLDNHGFRYYDPEVGRYTTRDPAGYAGGVNVYLYVGNNPINRIDPLGLIDPDPREEQLIKARKRAAARYVRARRAREEARLKMREFARRQHEYSRAGDREKEAEYSERLERSIVAYKERGREEDVARREYLQAAGEYTAYRQERREIARRYLNIKVFSDPEGRRIDVSLHNRLYQEDREDSPEAAKLEHGHVEIVRTKPGPEKKKQLQQSNFDPLAGRRITSDTVNFGWKKSRIRQDAVRNHPIVRALGGTGPMGPAPGEGAHQGMIGARTADPLPSGRYEVRVHLGRDYYRKWTVDMP